MEIFIDSNIIIEGLKGNEIAVELLEIIRNNVDELYLFINTVVVSEITFQLSYKRKFSLEEIERLILGFQFLSENKYVMKEAFEIMKNYNLKPNDALILATCKHYGINYLLSLDEDFKTACEKEGILLINEPEKLKVVLGQGS